MDTTIFRNKSVETSKAASALCKRLFPSWSQPPTQGDLQRIITEGWKLNGNEEQIKKTGEWWLWARTLAIENTFSKETQISMIRIAAKAAVGPSPICFVSARSPELLHAQVTSQGDPSLPRSLKTVERLKQITDASRKFLPTSLVIVFADLAIDNLDKISAHCDIEEVIQENLRRLEQICQATNLDQTRIVRMSSLAHPGNSKLGDVLTPDGTPKISVVLDTRAERLIQIATNESFQSHRSMFGWAEEQSRKHNTNLGITMGLVGQAVKFSFQNAILIHNEAFIARGALNNLFTDPRNPLPVVCLKDLLESKKPK